MSETRLEYCGDRKRRPENPHLESPQEYDPYVPSQKLIEAVNLAIYIERPLLLEGEAGCGKTRLAQAVAYELGLPFHAWNVHSTSKAREGLYEYDAILRLHDAHLVSQGIPITGQALSEKTVRDPGKAEHYRRFGPLGKAFVRRDQRSVVLIDEIDKADIDFPNDLLSVLDDPWEFEIPETGEKIEADRENKPIVLITSNKEKGNLPAPFLRRCVYSFLEFPEEERLRRIVNAHYEDRKPGPSTDLVSQALERFVSLRRPDSGLYKKPGTSEFLDWLKALRGFGDAEYLAANFAPEKEKELPFPGLLLKLRSDWQRQVRP